MGAGQVGERPKAQVRRQVIAARDGLSPEQLVALSQAIRRRLLSLPAFQEAETILFYASFRSEVRTEQTIQAALEMGKQVALPRTRWREKQLDLCLVRDPNSELKPSTVGIPEPIDSCPSVALGEVDLIIVPGAAFDLQGYRLGYGGGFYDRLLGQASDQPKIGLAFELQVLAEPLPIGPHDVKVDYVLTEDRLIDCQAEEKAP